MDSLVVVHELSSCREWASLLHGMWALSSLTRDWTRISCIARQILNYWTTREVPPMVLWPSTSIHRGADTMTFPRLTPAPLCQAFHVHAFKVPLQPECSFLWNRMPDDTLEMVERFWNLEMNEMGNGFLLGQVHRRNIFTTLLGLPWCLSGKESAC